MATVIKSNSVEEAVPTQLPPVASATFRLYHRPGGKVAVKTLLLVQDHLKHRLVKFGEIPRKLLFDSIDEAVPISLLCKTVHASY